MIFLIIKIDKINKPERPIPSGRISLKNAKNYSYSLFIISTILSILISYLVLNIIPFLIVIICCGIMYLYARYFKAMPLIGNIVVGSINSIMLYIRRSYTILRHILFPYFNYKFRIRIFRIRNDI